MEVKALQDYSLNLSMLELYILETSNLLEQLENIIIQAEKNGMFNESEVNEVFRCVHTIKGSSAVMKFDNIASLSHNIEDLFYYIRENKITKVEGSFLSDIILEGIDFIKVEVEKVKGHDVLDGNPTKLIEKIKQVLIQLKTHASIPVIEEKKEETYQYFSVKVYFAEGCEMENIRAFTLITNLKEVCINIKHFPENILEDTNSIEFIKEKGFFVYLKTIHTEEKMLKFLNNTPFLRNLELKEMKQEEVLDIFDQPEKLVVKNSDKKNVNTHDVQQSISVNVNKLDKLMDLVGEMVIAESMVTQNPEIQNLNLENFYKATVHLHKITKELQDIVMAIRMVPLSTTFFKMHRIVRDMSKKLSKGIELVLLGEETEVDKNIIEQISDPIMHLIRNAIDHGIEDPTERLRKGKNEEGQITLEAQNYGSDVFIRVKDDGKGMDKQKILQKAIQKGLLEIPPEELAERDILNLILMPGFSTKEDVTEFSGRGVGMDVVSSNIKALGGSVFVDSVQDKGTTITMKIPLTLAIIDGMNVKVGNARYTIPTISIREAFRPIPQNCIKDTENNEMIMVRGKCYPILRLHDFYGVATNVTDFSEGILVMVEQAEVTLCLFVDELIGQQQVVVKSLPAYIKKTKNIRGLSGCTLLGDGSISLILDISQLTV
ncbi:MAG: chemotaxis protein CheW [Cellulosilyticaceae bacterium]